MRLDKLLSKSGGLSRKEAAAAVRSGRVLVNGVRAKKADCKIDEEEDGVVLDGRPLVYRKFTYIMLHKPIGYVSSTDDPGGPTVLELLPAPLSKGLFPCGRLDKNTTGLLILTDDGEFCHRLLTPRNHVPKDYLFSCARPVTEEDKKALESGVDIGGYVTRPCVLTLRSPTEGIITVTEGKYHQIKLMFQSRCNKILSLHRLSFGGVSLDESLTPGAYRLLTDGEREKLCALPHGALALEATPDGLSGERDGQDRDTRTR